jgi:hypothetical protein
MVRERNNRCKQGDYLSISSGKEHRHSWVSAQYQPLFLPEADLGIPSPLRSRPAIAHARTAGGK